MADTHHFPEEMREIVESFVAETQEILEGVNRDLLALERAGGSPDLIVSIFRAVHTVKGTSSFLEFDQLHSLAHHFEEVLNELRKGRLPFNQAILDVLFEASDAMSALLQQVVDRQITRLPLDGLLGRLASLAEGNGSTPASPVDSDVESDHSGVDGAADGTPSRKTVRVEVDRLDAMLMLVGELACTRTRLRQLVDEADGLDVHSRRKALHDTSTSLDALTTSLRAAVLEMRLVRADHVFLPFPRIARDLARQLEKKVRLECRGTDTEIDRAIADQLREPLIHLVRNAIDHGIEPPEVRRRCGKPEEGRVTLRARRFGRDVEISVEDDGAGIDPDVLRKHAVHRDLLDRREASDLEDSEAYALIWEPGFTTSSTVTEVSGRGVGLDVVRASIAALGGTVAIESTRGGGTRFLMRLPRTISILPSMIVQVAGSLVAFPVETIEQIQERRSLSREGFRDDFRREGPADLREVPGLMPSDRMNGSADGRVSDESFRGCLVVRSDQGSLPLAFDRLVGREDVIVQTSEAFRPESEFVMARALLRDGRPVHVLNVGAVVQHFLSEAHPAAARPGW